MKIIITASIIFFLAISLVSAYQFPEPFIQGDKADVAIVLSNTSTNQEKIVAADIFAWMQTELAQSGDISPPGGYFGGKTIYYDSETGFENKNIISISVQCNNRLSNLYYSFRDDCNNFYDLTGIDGAKYNYTINAFESHYNPDKIIMVILAYNDEGLIQAQNFLKEKPEFIIQEANQDFCSDVGLRQDGKYCSQEKIWEEQKVTEVSCNNHFECASNFCVNETCVAPSLIDKLIRWFKDLFG